MVSAEAEILMKRFGQLQTAAVTRGPCLAQNPAASEAAPPNVQGEQKGQSKLADGLNFVISSMSRRSCVTLQPERTLLPGYKRGWNVHLSGTSFLSNEKNVTTACKLC